MASYNLNDVLKKKDMSSHTQSAEVALDDVSRVKVLSPTRQVVKRFLRNRLAVFGFVSIIILFIFCFLGPIFYPTARRKPSISTTQSTLSSVLPLKAHPSQDILSIPQSRLTPMPTVT